MTCQKAGGNDCKESINKQRKIPLNISKVTWEDVFINGTKVPLNKKEKTGIPVTKTKTTTRSENDEELTFINLKIQFDYPKNQQVQIGI